jgi:hypothetical protein
MTTNIGVGELPLSAHIIDQEKDSKSYHLKLEHDIAIPATDSRFFDSERFLSEDNEANSNQTS